MAAGSPAFEAACASLEQRSGLDRLAARGTIRLMLKDAGLEPKTVTARELAVAVRRLLPGELSTRGHAEDAEALSVLVVGALERVEDRPGGDTPEAVFARLGGS